MNSINNTINGLASSLFLNVGLTRVAEKFDPVKNQGEKSINVLTSVQASEDCVWACNFRPEAGQ